MKTLVNKENPAIRITAPEIGTGTHGYYYVNSVGYRQDQWTLVEEEEKINCPFDKGNCNYCPVQFCGAREQNRVETRSTAEPEVDLEKAAEEYVMQTASGTAEEMETLIEAFKAGYELGRIAQIEQNKALADMHKSPKEKEE